MFTSYRRGACFCLFVYLSVYVSLSVKALALEIVGYGTLVLVMII